MSKSQRWEHGSEFDWPAGWEPAPAADHPWPANAWFGGSGRDVLRAALSVGISGHGWRRLWIPTFLCQEVVAAAVDTGLPCVLYADRPGTGRPADLARLSLQPGDAVMLVNHFGLRAAPQVPDGVAVLEDHTHDPWSDWARTSSADFAMASLRKTLPTPDGGVLWSPAGHELPEPAQLTPERELAAERKRAGSLLKRAYLDGQAVSKTAFRELQLAGEEHIATGPVSAMTLGTRALLDAMPVASWRRRRAAGVAHLASRLQGRIDVLPADAEATGVPFSVVARLPDRATRDRVRRAAIAASIYPAVLWPVADAVLAGMTDADRDLADRVMSVHCDHRYSTADLDRVADVLLGALAP